ncbi:hypothetical protein EYF80_048669 [Liparis tanakae]|uniref:Uncharacterized protein n=1 Tax=Liparis tanakae TaxID=230148 RepID=A0A4Z2FK44_9TELE|nr:hypothetical protein EYF80_048669 [Liparis tanakae]
MVSGRGNFLLTRYFPTAPRVGSEPELLQERVAAWGEGEALQQGVEVSEVALVKGHCGFSLQHALLLPRARRGEGEGRRKESTEEASKAIHATALQKDLAHTSHLLWSEPEPLWSIVARLWMNKDTGLPPSKVNGLQAQVVVHGDGLELRKNLGVPVHLLWIPQGRVDVHVVLRRRASQKQRLSSREAQQGRVHS